MPAARPGALAGAAAELEQLHRARLGRHNEGIERGQASKRSQHTHQSGQLHRLSRLQSQNGLAIDSCLLGKPALGEVALQAQPREPLAELLEHCGIRKPLVDLHEVL